MAPVTSQSDFWGIAVLLLRRHRGISLWKDLYDKHLIVVWFGRRYFHIYYGDHQKHFYNVKVTDGLYLNWHSGPPEFKRIPF